ncbi:hypothetical protein HHI36_011615 [Cryptolaemus montrouzieri]|uniref:Uncharacterized protein n=1 Tax=Cryptolaemus montrouzieri TaxID=559131 RepID=A0ABD2MMI7_9CUCU
MVQPITEIQKFYEKPRRSLSPELKITGTDGENIEIQSPTPTRKIKSEIATSMETENISKLPVEMKNPCKIKTSHIIQEKGEPRDHFLSEEKNVNEEKTKISSRSSSPEKPRRPIVSNRSPSPNRSKKPAPPPPNLNEKQQTEFTSSNESCSTEAIVSSVISTVLETFPEEKLLREKTKPTIQKDNLTTEDKINQNHAKPKPSSVSFSINDKLEKSTNSVEPANIPSSIKSPLNSPMNQKPSTSTLSPNVLRAQSPSGSDKGKSPLASRSIHRVPKKYQPKYGWL